MNLSLNQFLCQGLSSFSPKGFCYSHTWSCSLWRGTSFCTELTSRKLSIFFLGFWLVLLRSVSYFVYLYWSPFFLCEQFFDVTSSNTDEVLSINPPVHLFALGGFNIHHKGWITYSGGLVDLTNCYDFIISIIISDNLTPMVNFPNSPDLLDSFLLSGLSFLSIQNFWCHCLSFYLVS